MLVLLGFYSHVNYSVTKINNRHQGIQKAFYSHVNYSVTKIVWAVDFYTDLFYSHVNYSVTKIIEPLHLGYAGFTVT